MIYDAPGCKRFHGWLLAVAVIVVGPLLRDLRAAEDAPPAKGEILAWVGNTPISADVVDQKLANRLLRLRAEEFNLRRSALDEVVGQQLLQAESAARGITIDALLRTEVEEKAGAAADPDLRQQRLSQRRNEFLRELRAKAGVRILIQPPRLDVDVSTGASLGPASAPVVLVEFSDFQCPACQRAEDSLQRVRTRYGDRVRLVFRHFPLPMHKDARLAAEAAACAQEQGRFWEMHDKLFENQRALSAPELKRTAIQLGLSADEFAQCLDSGKQAQRVADDIAAGRSYGVSATPTFLVNGRPLSGGRYEALARVIDEELERDGAPVTRAPLHVGHPAGHWEKE
jgi:protein-disulfide isomerase